MNIFTEKNVNYKVTFLQHCIFIDVCIYNIKKIHEKIQNLKFSFSTIFLTHKNNPEKIHEKIHEKYKIQEL